MHTRRGLTERAGILKVLCAWGLFTVNFSLLPYTPPALAEEYVFGFTPTETTCSPLEDIIKANRIDARFNTVTNRLRWSVNFAPPPVADFPEFYYIVINDGPMPRATPGSLAILYFDATTPTDPKLTVYGYSGENNGGSYFDGSGLPGVQAPDRILSSLATQDWINELSVIDLPNGSRTLTFDIDASAIITHVPLYPDPGFPWFGTGFAQNVGLWFHMFKNVSVSYGDQGFLSFFSGIEDCYDLDNLATVEDLPPVCDAGPSPYLNDCEGILSTIPLDGSSSSDPEMQVLSYLWSTSCTNASISPDNQAQTVLTLENPGTGQPQSCAVTLTVSDGATEVSCPASIQVPACEIDCLGVPNGSAQPDMCGVCNGANLCVDCAGVPFGQQEVDQCGVCGGDGQSCLGCEDTSITGVQLSLDGNFGELRGLVYHSAARLLSIRDTKRLRTFSRTARRDADKLYNLGWINTYAIPGSFAVCENSVLCSQVSLAESIASFSDASIELNDLVTKVVRRMIRVRGRVSKGDRKTRIEARALLTENLALASALPTSLSNCQGQ